MTTDQILAACRMVKEAGTSSKVPVPIVTLEPLARDAELWRSLPPDIKDAVKLIGGKNGG
jgi:hypothetical protein